MNGVGVQLPSQTLQLPPRCHRPRDPSAVPGPAPSLTGGAVCGQSCQPCWAAARNPDAVSQRQLRPHMFKALNTGRVSSPCNNEELLWGHFPACLRSPHTSTPSLPRGLPPPPCRTGVRVPLLKECGLAHGLSSRALPMAPIFLLLPLRKRQGDAWCGVGSAGNSASGQGAGEVCVCDTRSPRLASRAEACPAGSELAVSHMTERSC